MMAPTWLQALILGLAQGLTEFIPVSSSAHLVARAGLERFVIYLVLLGAVGLLYFD